MGPAGAFCTTYLVYLYWQYMLRSHSHSTATSLGCNLFRNTLKYLSTLEYIAIHLGHTLVLIILVGTISQVNNSLQALQVYS